MTLLHMAIEQISIACHQPLALSNIIQRLVRLGADINARRGDNGASPLFEAATWRLTDVVRELLLLGADPDLENEFGLYASWECY
jgi:ankyrin repeat protein